MKKIKNIISIVLFVLALGFAPTSCTPKEEDNVAKAVRGSQSVLEFAADSPQGQVLTVFSDAQWHVKAPDWITVDPSTGFGKTEVTVIASSNTDSKGKLAPRKDTLIFSGNTLASRYTVIVKQDGDAYRNATEKSVKDLASLKDEDPVIVKQATVAALTSKGYVITDGTANSYVLAKSDVKIGESIDIKGIKGTMNGMAVIKQVDGVSVLSEGTFTAPEPLVITETIATYKPNAMDYIKFSGVESSGNIVVTIEEQDYAVTLVDPAEGLSIDGLTAHKIDVTGYSYGVVGANTIAILPVVVKDNGPAVVPKPDKLLKAKWRFTTKLLTDYASYFGGTAGVVDLKEGFGDLYVPSNIEGDGKITYYQVDKTGTSPSDGNPKRIVGGTGHPYITGAWPGDYWQFSATDNYEYPAETKLHIIFYTRVSGTGQKYWMLEYFDGKDWKPADEYPVATETSTGTNAQYNFIESKSNVKVECYWTLAAPCREPKFRMRCVANWQLNDKGALENPNGGTCRIADNDDGGDDIGPLFEVTDSPGGGDIPVHQTFFQDDFSWTEPIAAAVKAAGQPVGKTVEGEGTDAPNIWGIEDLAKAFEPVFKEKGYTDLNKAEKLVYLQDGYLKFSRTGGHNTALQLEVSTLPDTPTDVLISFDYCMMVQGSGAIDEGPMGVLLIGDGEFENGTKLSAGLVSAQTTGKFLWNKSGEIKAKGVTNKTKFVFLMERVWVDGAFKWNVGGAGRFFLDNIVIKN